MYAIVGIHPHHADKIDVPKGTNETNETKGDGENEMMKAQDPEVWLKKLEQLAQQPKVVGIGEIGLDYYRYQSNGTTDPNLQKKIFEAQIQLAHVQNLPIQIHNRHAGEDAIEILTSHKNLLRSEDPGMFHCFAGSLKVHKQALQLGFCIGFDGNSTYPGLAPGETVSLSELIKLTPLDRIVTETDSPFLTPIPHRGTQNKPGYVIIVGEFIAKTKNLSFEEVNQQTEANAKRVFNLK